MIQKYANLRRAKSITYKSARELSNKLKETPDSGLRPKIISAVRIEQRLLNSQITYNRKLQSLRNSLEEEQLKEVWDKPKITEKSRVLAQKAEKKLLEQLPSTSQTPKDPSSPTTEKELAQVQPEHSAKSVPKARRKTLSVDTQSHKKNVSRPLFAEFTPQPLKTRTKSLLNLSVIERNQVWLEEKQSKLTKRKKEIEEKEVEGCTFSPTTQFSVKHSRSMRDPNSNMSFLSSPLSLELSEIPEQGLKAAKMPLYRQIAPYQVKISFKCGIDLNSFLKRAK